ncbi:23S rRNA pseudouridine(955/2504/2580) synthase RluC [Candidatus Palibaumannia cicadellinicola]|uniref:Pseudouridine synthase n=1 Tax=Baumannia cicadellinicola subsp. Homalodisca coagulata TaxID=374463 RepID=Q1LT34_BAUCH|nr:23S rRNA pseudouridine(955/2504/2580) synthase RluC [Candidatus Baumannia cicadellinicola]ABF14200.1 ribosomal large subunit pseudouridine synthase C [Baumannia cicadellinicola str. Hc (Homalodisca coagulata)]MBS0032795.1 23S rRNA pseudouridine(955/2504/2580) synthase RluC [Candidatus Baumannia cicadellinicola]MBS0032860.1 23S rRNA pseudouridine(955/2504/2580) synthase RluC [Candidatus Baumannia cicadellinicola]MCJ7462081.1 23S rRNA pseudouridine(955/2504/2580) synthase RluC [Candidatus Baum
MKEHNSQISFISISIHEAGQRIDNFLRTKLKGVPKSLIYRIIRKGEVRINKKRIKPQYKLQSGDQIRLPPVWRNNITQLFSPQLKKVAVLADTILYEDDYILVLNKPAGTAVHGGYKLSFGVIEGLRALWPFAKFLELIHRLDRDTSGALLVAKKRSALRLMHEQLRMKNINKHYLALVRGQWESDTVVEVPLMKKIQSNGKHIVQVSSDGKMSKTFFKIEENFTIATLVNASPITGRTHQIRVHSQYAGHPIAFDDRYGDNEFDQQLKKCGLSRLFLHAVALSFKHPISGEILRIEAPLDESLLNCLLYLRTYHNISHHLN